MRKGGTLVAVILMLIIAGGLVAHAHAERQDAYLFYDEGAWIVESGDTLWEIASFYSNNNHDVREVIHIIKGLNDTDLSTIYPGQMIFVPLFENMDWPYHEGE